jgi:hypothetical protein
MRSADDSKWGMCNRFCPWCTLCADKHLREKEVNLDNREEERSLTGRSAKLNEAYGKSLSDKAGDEKKADISNPLHKK